MVCPKCHNDVAKLKKGTCPHCGVALRVMRGGLYPVELGNPAEQLVTVFEGLVSRKLSTKSGKPVQFSIPKKTAQYRAEVASAWRYLALCNHNFDLAVEALRLLFEHKMFAYKTYTTLPYLSRDFVAAKAIAEAVLREREEKQTREQTAFDRVMQKEDIFA